jgi:hypothetical protein
MLFWSRKTHLLWFYGKVGELDFDLKCYFWKGGENFFSYSSTLG